MKLRFAERVVNSSSDEVQDALNLILSLTERPDVISFAGGLPDPDLFPLEEMMQISQQVLMEEGKQALQYSSTEGYIRLRKQIAEEIMKDAKVDASEENIIITCGSQQGLEITGRVFLNEGDVVICESPSYLGAITAFNSYKPRYVEVNMDEDGIIIVELEEALRENPNTKFIYTIPDFQNPTGRTLSLERRKRMVELAEKYGVLIVEDNPYGNLMFEGNRLPAIKSFDKNGHVIYLGTFSKIFCPGLRIGWVCADKEILEKYVGVKQSLDLNTNTMAQREVSAYMKKFDINENVDKIKKVYKRRRDLMVNTIKKEFPDSCKYTQPSGGLFVWVTLPESMDASNVLKRALDEKAAFVPGIAFYANGGKKNNFRLNYSSMSDENIVEGIKRLGKVLKEM